MNNLAFTALALACGGAALFAVAPADAQQFPEVNVSTVPFGDIEFDSARDGTNCPTCNFGQGNSRFNWTDQQGNLWLGHVDFNTGDFVPTNGEAELVDTVAVFWRLFGNGPEWAFSQKGSQLVYTRYKPGELKTRDNVGAAVATMVDGKWAAAFLPGGLGAILPEASQWLPDPEASVIFKSILNHNDFWDYASALQNNPPHATPFGAYANGIGERWVPGTHQLTFQGSAPPDAQGNVYQQVFWYDTDSDLVQQLTADPHNKHEAFMFYAPEFDNALVFFTVSGGIQINIYQQTGVNPAGAPTFKIVNTIRSPDPVNPYIDSPEPFINCSPTCKTYIFMALSSTSQNNDETVANELAVTNIDPSAPLFKLLTDASSPPWRRLDPEYFITANGPYLYYTAYTVETATTPMKPLGEFYIDMQLGPPTGTGGTAE